MFWVPIYKYSKGVTYNPAHCYNSVTHEPRCLLTAKKGEVCSCRALRVSSAPPLAATSALCVDAVCQGAWGGSKRDETQSPPVDSTCRGERNGEVRKKKNEGRGERESEDSRTEGREGEQDEVKEDEEQEESGWDGAFADRLLLSERLQCTHLSCTGNDI